MVHIVVFTASIVYSLYLVTRIILAGTKLMVTIDTHCLRLIAFAMVVLMVVHWHCLW